MQDPEDEPGGRARGLIAAILALAVLVAAGLWLSGALRSTAAVQDCVMAGRSNCAPLR